MLILPKNILKTICVLEKLHTNKLHKSMSLNYIDLWMLWKHSAYLSCYDQSTTPSPTQ